MNPDQENAKRAAICAIAMRVNIEALAGSQNPILSEYATSLLNRFAAIERELARLAEVVE